MVANQKTKKRVNRREFLGMAWAVSLFGLLGQAGTALLNFLKPRVEPGAFGAEVAAGQVDEFEPGTVNHVQKGRFYISRLEDGGMLALWHRCTHLGCTVPWREDEGQFHCPCHSSIFTTVGEVVSGPAPRPLDIFPVTVTDGEIVVDTGNPIQRHEFDPSQVTYP
ncbi:MAG: ubiquinol-cytochrome c reductase iron-sulfur subunit [Anaerolineae bacterium]